MAGHEMNESVESMNRVYLSLIIRRRNLKDDERHLTIGCSG